jgi:hypothetical protein
MRDLKARRAPGGVATQQKAGPRRTLRLAIRLCCGQPRRRPGRWRPPGGWAATLCCCAISWASAADEAWGWLRALFCYLSAVELAGDGFTVRSGCRVSAWGLFSFSVMLSHGLGSGAFLMLGLRLGVAAASFCSLPALLMHAAKGCLGTWESLTRYLTPWFVLVSCDLALEFGLFLRHR